MPSSERRRIGVIGATGQLGTDLLDVLNASPGCEAAAIPHTAADVRDAAALAGAIGAGGYQAVINCAAFHKVEDCEADAAQSFAVNAEGALNVARACTASGALCVFISTDYVFGGDKGGLYAEDDPTRPVNVYGVSKVAGELLVQQATQRSLILRISSVFGRAGARGKGGNFVEAILARAKSGQPVRVIDDQWMSPTYTRDAAELVRDLLAQDATGVYHCSNTGRCTWFEFAQAILESAQPGVVAQPIRADELASKAARPRDSSMDNRRVASVLGRPVRPWRGALQAYLAEKGHVAAG